MLNVINNYTNHPQLITLKLTSLVIYARHITEYYNYLMSMQAASSKDLISDMKLTLMYTTGQNWTRMDIPQLRSRETNQRWNGTRD